MFLPVCRTRMNDVAARAAVAERAARAGAAVANERFRTGIDVETKTGKTNVVTQADRDAQARVIEVIEEAFPTDTVVGEEEGAASTVPEEGAAWIVDPIDGTNNYVRDIPIWATSVAAVADGGPVAAANVLPALGDAYVADGDETRLNGRPVATSDRSDPEKCAVCPTLWWNHDRRDEYTAATRAIVERFGDLRRFGCAQATFATIAHGGLDGAFSNIYASPWDTVAGVHMIRKADGRVTDVDGERWRHDSEGIVASNGAAHEHVLAAARDVVDA